MRMSWETGREKGKLQTVIENVMIIQHIKQKKKNPVLNRDNVSFGKNRQEVYNIEKKLLRPEILALRQNCSWTLFL